MGTRKVVVLHTDDAVMTDPGEMAQQLQDHSKRVAQGGYHDLAAVNEYLRNTPKPRNWKRLSAPVLLRDVMRKPSSGAQQETARQGWMALASRCGMHWRITWRCP